MSRDLTDGRALLDAWEAGAVAPSAARGATLAHHCGLVPDADTALDLPLGEIARLAARLYTAGFGSAATCVVSCPDCAERLEVRIDLDPLADAEPESAAPRPVPTSGGEVLVRPVTSRDLLAAATTEANAALLLASCLVGDHPAVDRLQPDDVAAIDTKLEELAGAAAATVQMRCPQCGTAMRIGVDVVALLWDQVRSNAPRLLAEIVTLATAYGWSEQSVLAMSATRRQAYLALVRR
ncbi:hypothetical protein GCM10009678_72240 [Actinomadura kijaniata]|uniref:Uncharacterized protein YbaR (Trm112 family) n=1 Tax=Actinomadura namibiensis TaxID=182080 RepID=A0A7W3QRG3_ACTNM|nr:hypothetical protein [Actinomadura namibiensis]MBA8956592.1 uncharacterized protein YbaR (Trm112 family) [Actinomadura namibiensis]